MQMFEFSMEELIPIVAMLSDQYTSRESSSISYDKAKQFMEAVLYCIREFEQTELNNLGRMYPSAKYLAKEAYLRGYELVVQKTKKTLVRYNALVEEFQSYGNQNYYDTIIKGLPEFFRFYDAKFKPQDHILMLDYPVLSSIYDLNGIDAISTYITYIDLENTFLKRLPTNYVVTVLKAYHTKYKDLYENLSSIVMRNILGSMLSGKPIQAFGYCNTEYSTIREKLLSASREQIAENLYYLLQILINRQYGENTALYDYLAADIENYSHDLKNAAEHNCLERFFLI